MYVYVYLVVGGSAVAGEEEDLWRVLDPHDGSAYAVRPLKKGVFLCMCLCVCVHSLSLPTHGRTLTGRTVRRPSTQSKSSQAAMSIDLWAKQTRSLKAPSLPEFSEVFLQERNIYMYIYATGSYAPSVLPLCVLYVNMYILPPLTPESFLQERNRILRLRLAAAKVYIYM